MLTTLPDELILRICSFMEYHQLLLLAPVSKHLHKITADNVLWKELFEQQLDLLPFVQNTTLVINKYSPRRTHWKDFYYESYFKQRMKYMQHNNPSSNGAEYSANGQPTSMLFTSLRTQRTRILFMGPKHAGKATLFYHLKFGTLFKGIYYLRKYGTVVSIDLNLNPRKHSSFLNHEKHSSSLNEKHSSLLNHDGDGIRKHSSSLSSDDGFPPVSDVLPADLEVWDTEDFDSSPFKRTCPPEGVVMVVDSTTMQKPSIVSVLNSLHSSPHIGPGVPVLVLATHWDNKEATHAAGVARALGLWNHPGRPWRVQSCCATSLLGVKEGLQWLQTEIREKKSWES